MSDVVRAVGYVGGLQRLTWNGPSVQVQAYLWGGGGGGGGANDSGAGKKGGNGTGGAFSQINLALDPGDVLDVAVAQGGGGGGGGGRGVNPGAVGGLAGQSLIYNVFDTRSQTNVVPVSDPRWSLFMNAHAVWDPGGSGVTPIFRSYMVNFPVTGYYVFQFSADNSMTVQLEGETIISYSGFSANPPPLVTRFITAGNENLTIQASNAGDVAGVALTITASFSGGDGSAPTQAFLRGGGGGGGGGATAMFKNGQLIATAGGGGGGGGGGLLLGASPDAPGANGVTLPGLFAGQTGQTRGNSDGGGAGGGGGGYAGGQGGSVQGPDFNGTGGSPGTGLGIIQLPPNARTAGGSFTEYYAGGSRGGSGDVGSGPATAGQNGYAVVVFNIPRFYVRDNAVWVPVQDVYVRQNNSWQLVKNNLVRNAGAWRGFIDPPTFGSAPGTWGRNPRTNN